LILFLIKEIISTDVKAKLPNLQPKQGHDQETQNAAAYLPELLLPCLRNLNTPDHTSKLAI